LPNFVTQQGGAIVGGILGMDMLYIRHAIIDLRQHESVFEVTTDDADHTDWGAHPPRVLV
jgi:hypothetical protein